MTTQIEQTGTLGRKLAMTLPMDQIQKEVSQRLRQLSKTVKMSGFRPGKVPVALIEKNYGAQVSAEVTGDAVSKAFGEAVEEHKLRVAGQPNIERAEDAPENEFGFTATFEVYPEVPDIAPDSLKIEKIICEVGDTEIDKTVEILRKQRVQWEAAERAAATDDQVTIDFIGRIDNEAFDGGTADDFAFILGEGRMLADFETGVTGRKAGETVSFPVAFPDDYSAEELKGKTAEFEVTIKKVEAPVLPAVDAEFARSLGIEDGDLQKMRADIRANLEREVSQRTSGQTKNNVMEALAGASSFELPAALLDGERASLVERAKQDLAQRGMDMKNMPIPEDAFKEQAETRVRLGLLVAELVKTHELQAKSDQIRSQIDIFAQAYENPAEVVRHYYSNRDRLAEIEALVIEQNVVDWALSKAEVTDKKIAFEELMGQQN
ncbi:MAG: trigger factor [Burkholderiaceae bacterium]